MREELAAARGFPLQLRGHGDGVDGDQDQIRQAGKMLRGGARKLRRRGEMDEAVALIGRLPDEKSFRFGRLPQCPLADFVDRRHTFRPQSGRRTYRR